MYNQLLSISILNLLFKSQTPSEFYHYFFSTTICFSVYPFTSFAYFWHHLINFNALTYLNFISFKFKSLLSIWNSAMMVNDYTNSSPQAPQVPPPSLNTLHQITPVNNTETRSLTNIFSESNNNSSFNAVKDKSHSMQGTSGQKSQGVSEIQQKALSSISEHNGQFTKSIDHPEEIPQQSETFKSLRPTANIAKKFINEYVSTLNTKSDKKKRTSGDDEIKGKKKIQQHKYPLAQQFRSKRKIRPQDHFFPAHSNHPADRLSLLELQNKDCQNLNQKKTQKKSSLPVSTSYQNNVHHQFFYCNYDRTYFQQNEYQYMLEYAEQSHHNLYSDNRKIQKAMGKPKLTTFTWFKEERLVLQQTRNYIRSSLKQPIDQSDARSKYLKDTTPLLVGQTVQALHPTCGHLHIGSILAMYKQNLIMIKFQNPELGVQKILDLNISSQFTMKKGESYLGFQAQNYEIEQQPTKQQEVVENIDFYAMGFVLRLLQYKNSLIDLFKELNNKLEIGQEISQEFKQEYGWVGSVINLVDIALKQVLTKFRLRGTHHYPKQDISQNLPKLLVTPLTLMQKQLESNHEDMLAARQIRQIISTHQEKKIDDAVHALCSKIKQEKKIQQRNIDSQLQDLVKACISLLFTLKSQGKIMNLPENKHMRLLATELYKTDRSKLSEINDLVHSISLR